MSASLDSMSINEITEALQARQIEHDPLRPVVILNRDSLKPKPPQNDDWSAVGKLHSNIYVNYQEAQIFGRKQRCNSHSLSEKEESLPLQILTCCWS